MSYLDWHVGMEVECIAGADDDAYIDADSALTVGDHCTISWVGTDSEGGLVIDLFEHPAPETLEWARGWLAKYFRPVAKRSTDISIFTQLLISPKLPVDA